jgi:hypothetical protein
MDFMGSCRDCPVICSECNQNFQCLACVEKAWLDGDKCYCIKGYQIVGNSCVQKFFYGNLTISKENRVFLNFDQVLEVAFNSTQVEITVNLQVIEIKMYQKNLSFFIFTPQVAPFTGEKRKLVLTINTTIFSESASQLFNYTFEGHLLALAESEPATIFGFDSGTGVKIGVSTAIGTSIVSNPSALWSLLSTIQLITFMPLNAVAYPDKLRNISSSFIDYNMVPNLFKLIFNPNSTSVPYENALNYGIESSVLLINTGPMFGLLTLSAFFLIIFLLITRLPIKSEKIILMKSKYKYNLLLRFWIQSYLEFGLFAIIQLKSVIFI